MFLKALLAILALPFMVVGIIPTIIITYDPYRMDEYIAGYIPLTIGLWLFFQCIRDFYVMGKGTLAPWAPPEKFVRVGFYRYTRSPMYLGVLLIISGLGLRFGSPLMGAYLIFVATTFHLNLLFIEEPRLARRFGDEWLHYIKEVPRWLPRLSARK